MVAQGWLRERVKDLVDMLLFGESGTLDSTRLVENVQGTFRRRKTHAVPGSLPPSPEVCEECPVLTPSTETTGTRIGLR